MAGVSDGLTGVVAGVRPGTDRTYSLPQLFIQQLGKAVGRHRGPAERDSPRDDFVFGAQSERAVPIVAGSFEAVHHRLGQFQTFANPRFRA